MTTQTALAKNARPGALVRKKPTWPPFDPAREIESPRFHAPQPWQPQRWERARPARAS